MKYSINRERKKVNRGNDYVNVSFKIWAIFTISVYLEEEYGSCSDPPKNSLTKMF